MTGPSTACTSSRSAGSSSGSISGGSQRTRLGRGRDGRAPSCSAITEPDEWLTTVAGAASNASSSAARVRGVSGDLDQAGRRRAAGVTRAQHPDHPPGQAAGQRLEPGAEHRRRARAAWPCPRRCPSSAMVAPSIFVVFISFSAQSVGVEPDLDPVGVVQADQDRAAVVARDQAAVRLARLVRAATFQASTRRRGSARAGPTRRSRTWPWRGPGRAAARAAAGSPRARSATPRSTPSSTNSIDSSNPSTRSYQARLRATSLTGSLTWWNAADRHRDASVC